MSRPTATLAGTDAVIFASLTRLVAYGRHSGTFNGADVARVVLAHLPGAETFRRKLRAETVRADVAEQRARVLAGELEQARAEAAPPPQTHAHRTVVLTPACADVVIRACRGASPTDISRVTGLTPGAVATHLHRASVAMTADTTQHAVALVSRGVVQVRIKQMRRRAA